MKLWMIYLKIKQAPFKINGISFKNRKEYDERVKQDAAKLAELLYDIYWDRKRSEGKEDNITLK